MSYELLYQSHAKDPDLDHETVSGWLNANGIDATLVREVAVYRVGDVHEIHAVTFVLGDGGLRANDRGDAITEHITRPMTAPLPESLPRVTTCRVCGR